MDKNSKSKLSEASLYPNPAGAKNTKKPDSQDMHVAKIVSS